MKYLSKKYKSSIILPSSIFSEDGNLKEEIMYEREEKSIKKI